MKNGKENKRMEKEKNKQKSLGGIKEGKVKKRKDRTNKMEKEQN